MEEFKSYRIFKKAHPFKEEQNFFPKKDIISYRERMEYLYSYAKKAQEVYEKYKNEPQKIEDEQEKRMFSQYLLYTSYESELILVEIFREKVKKAASIAEIIRNLEKKSKKDDEKINSLRVRFGIAKAEVEKMINDLGPLLELAFRRELEKEDEYKHKFNMLSKKEAKLKVLMEMPIGDVLTAHEVFQEKMAEDSEGREKISVSRQLKRIAQGRDWLRVEDDLQEILNNENVLAVLKELSQETGEDLISFAESLVRKEEKEEGEYRSKKEIEEELKKIEEQLDKLWEEERTRYYLYQSYLEKLIFQDQMGEPVLEIPSLIKLMNELAAWERRHTETPIGGVLIGPPGTGKSLGIEYYLRQHPEHKKKGPPVVIDMSQETTEFMLLGGEAIEITDKAKTIEAISRLLDQEKEIERKLKTPWISKKDKKILEEEKERLDKVITDILHALLGHYVELRKELGKELTDEEVNKYAKDLIKEEILTPEQKKRLKEKINSALKDWYALELGKIMYGNGWRDGIILKALKEGRDVIINEYNNFRLPPDALRQLFQTAYGEKWFFAGTGKEYPVYSRFYLTANAGSSTERFFYDTAQITAAFESRLPPPIEVKLPSIEEELLIIQARLSDTNRKFLCDKEIETKLQATGALKDYEFNLKYREPELIVYLIKKILPRLRALSVEAPKEVPSLDLRHITRFCRELVNPFTRERTTVSVEEAFVKHFLKPFIYNPTAFETLVKSGIVEEMYKIGLLHNRKNETINSFLLEVMAKKQGYDLSALSEEAKRNILTKIEKELQNFDEELIKNLEKIEGEDKWKEIIDKAKKEKRVLVLNPYLKETLASTFSKEFSRPEARSF